MGPTILLSLFLSVGIASASTHLESATDREMIDELREESRIETLLGIEDWLDEIGGFAAIRTPASLLREAMREKFGPDSFMRPRRIEVGPNRYQPGLNASSAEDEWEPVKEGNAIEAIIDFDRQLRERGIDLIVVPVPAKVELYYEDFEADLPQRFPICAPRLESILVLLDAEVEVLDILPLYWDEKPHAPVPLYEVSGHHPSGYGAKLAGELVASRLERYDFEGRDLDRFSDRRRTGTERVDRSVPMKAWQVMMDGKPYRHVDDSEVVVIGDSHAFAYRNASWASHIARATGIPVTDISESSGGARAHQKFARMGRESVSKRKVVIWILTGVILGSPRAIPKAVFSDEPIAEEVALAAEVRANLDSYYASRKADPNAPIEIPEEQLNRAGYELLRINELSLALEVFTVATVEFSQSANAFDSLGECLITMDRFDDARQALNKALELNPDEGLKTQIQARLKQIDEKDEGGDESG